MKASDIEYACELKRQLDGVRALQRGMRGHRSLRFGNFAFLTRGTIGSVSDQPAHLCMSDLEAADLFNKIEKRVENALAELGVRET